MVDTSERGAGVRIAPPIVYIATILAGVLLHKFALPFPLPLSNSVRLTGVLVSVLLGFGLIAAAMTLFRRTGQDPAPWKVTPSIVSGGIFRLTRNPMYVGMTSLQVSTGVGMRNGWILVMVPLTLLMIYVTAIRHEEAYLEREFGEAYLDYKKAVRRWL
jgi:protein-S-isoprenylcysteine O-methyltransferase Ste14